jgi:hypothetical protein
VAWNIEGTYFENCSCDAVCPCTWSSLSKPATHDFCKFLMAIHIDSGTIEGIDVAGRTFSVLAQTPKMMMDGNWKVGLFVDDKASSEQAAAIGKVVGGELGGPMAMLAPLIGEFLGVEQTPIEFSERDGTHSVKIGSSIDLEVQDMKAPDLPGATQLTNVMHPANTTLTIAPATRAQVEGFGISFGGAGTSGFSAPVSWAG